MCDSTKSYAKPLSTTSPEAILAVQLVTPGRLSSLLIDKGPLAIRHITQSLGNEIPCFKDLSSSKQRRIIMAVMESGDVQHNIVFEKIGWGQWNAKTIDNTQNFEKIRDETNEKNAKVKEIISKESQNRRKRRDREPVKISDEETRMNNEALSSANENIKTPSCRFEWNKQPKEETVFYKSGKLYTDNKNIYNTTLLPTNKSESRPSQCHTSGYKNDKKDGIKEYSEGSKILPYKKQHRKYSVLKSGDSKEELNLSKLSMLSMFKAKKIKVLSPILKNTNQTFKSRSTNADTNIKNIDKHKKNYNIKRRSSELNKSQESSERSTLPSECGNSVSDDVSFTEDVDNEFIQKFRTASTNGETVDQTINCGYSVDENNVASLLMSLRS